MALLPLVQKNHPSSHFPTFIFNFKQSIQSTRKTKMTLQSHMFNRRTTNILAAILLTRESTAKAIDFRMTTPEQTLEQAESGIKGHAQSLIKVKDLLEEESWKAAQKALRKSSAYLKQDIYTIIQSKPGDERSELRKLYSILFNSVTRLDYAARDKDVPLIWDCYQNLVAALNHILSRLYS